MGNPSVLAVQVSLARSPSRSWSGRPSHVKHGPDRTRNKPTPIVWRHGLESKSIPIDMRRGSGQCSYRSLSSSNRAIMALGPFSMNFLFILTILSAVVSPCTGQNITVFDLPACAVGTLTLFRCSLLNCIGVDSLIAPSPNFHMHPAPRSRIRHVCVPIQFIWRKCRIALSWRARQGKR